MEVAGGKSGDHYKAEVNQAGIYALVMIPEKVSLDCATGIKRLQAGDVDVELGCRAGAEASVWQEGESTLPEMMPFESRLVSSLTMQIPDGIPTTLTFTLPDGIHTQSLRLLHFDGRAGWVEVEGVNLGDGGLLPRSMNRGLTCWSNCWRPQFTFLLS